MQFLPLIDRSQSISGKPGHPKKHQMSLYSDLRAARNNIAMNFGTEGLSLALKN
jgi:hypothetical protein